MIAGLFDTKPAACELLHRYLHVIRGADARYSPELVTAGLRICAVLVQVVQFYPTHRAVFVAAKGREVKEGMRPDQRIAPTAIR